MPGAVRNTKSGVYYEFGGGADLLTKAGVYYEYSGDEAIGAAVFVTMAGVYYEYEAVVEPPPEPEPGPPSFNADRKPAFYASLQNPDFSNLLAQPFDLVPLRWSWNRPGGCQSAQIEVVGERADVFYSLPALLRSPVSIYNNNHSQVWWGFVNSIELLTETATVGISLDGMYNDVAVVYDQIEAGASSTTPAETSYLQDDESVNRWGKKSLRLSLGEMTAAAAALARNAYLEQARYILPDVRKGGNRKVAARLHCRGWWDVLGWQYYENAGTTATNISEQISDIVDTFSLIVGADIIDAHTTQTNEFRDGTETALSVIESLLSIPQSPTQRYTAIITPERYLRFLKEASSQFDDWLLMDDGSFRTFLNGIPDPGREIIGWTQLRGVLPANSWGYMVNPSPLYIEENEFDASTLRYNWRARGAISPWLG